MPKTQLREGSLVLYKNRPALIRRAVRKLEIELDGGEHLKVRLKDVTCLYPGPMRDLGELRPQVGEIETAWEILSGEAVSLADLADLIYGEFTPATAWSTWQLVADGLYFSGSPEKVLARLPEEVARERETRAAKAAERQAWEGFLERMRAGQIAAQDDPYLQDVEALAWAQRDESRVLRGLGRAERPENAHAFLLELGRWDHTINPHPTRLGIDTSAPDVALPELPEEERVDLTHLPAFAIDDEGNRDPDDALSLDDDRLWVHVADVAAVVHPNSAADLEARARGANLYLPEGTVPMLPASATDTLGLGLSEVSPALSFGLVLSAEGEVLGVEVVPSWVRVTRLTYAEADGRLEEEPFHRMYELALRHEAWRRERGAANIDLPEVMVQVQNGQVLIRPLPPLRSRSLVTEAMLMAGTAIANFALDRELPFPFSTQDPPFSGTPESPTSLSEMFALRRGLKRSQTRSAPSPHAGLGLPVYAQVTSPLRRYLDLVGHQQLRAQVRGEAPLDTQEVLERIGASEAITGSIRRAERLARLHWTLVYLLAHPDWHGEGILVSRRGSQGTVLIPELDLEPRVHLREDLPLDSPVPLSLLGVDLPALEARFRVGS